MHFHLIKGTNIDTQAICSPKQNNKRYKRINKTNTKTYSRIKQASFISVVNICTESWLLKRCEDGLHRDHPPDIP